MDDGHDQILFQTDDRHRIYLCEYGLVHAEWGKHSLVYCPGDLIGLSYMLTALNAFCDMECLRGEPCVLDQENHQVLLPYGSVNIPLTVEECRALHLAAQEAVRQLHQLRGMGYFSNQKWLPFQYEREDRISKTL